MFSHQSLLDLEDKHNCICELSKYQRGHSTLTILLRSHDLKEIKILKFIDVRYVQAPQTWIGAEFEKKSKSLSLRFAKSLGIGLATEGDFFLFESKINSRRRVSNNQLVQEVFDLMLRIIYFMSMTRNKNIVRVLAAYATLEDIVD